MSGCEHRWYRNFMLINTMGARGGLPRGIGAEHLCVDCGAREWEPLTPEEHKRRSAVQDEWRS